MAIDMNPEARPHEVTTHSVTQEAYQALDKLVAFCTELPEEFILHRNNVVFFTDGLKTDTVHFPCPLREQEAMLAIKAVEACAAAAIADLKADRAGTLQHNHDRQIMVDADKASCFLMSAYLTNVDGMGKQHVDIMSKVPDTDIHQAQSILYRRLSANLYETKNPGEYYHTHGSLEASTTLEMLGLPSHNPQMTDYRKCIDTIEAAVKTHTIHELDRMNVEKKQAGIFALTWEQFQQTPHGEALVQLPPFTVEPSEQWTRPIPFEPTGSPYALRGIKVLELCRIIAGPTIGRSLAAHGATVLKVTSSSLPDVSFFQVDVNTGKHTANINLKTASGRAVFDKLLADADVIIDGYRPGALARLGYSQKKLMRIATRRNRGFVYVAEDCFGGSTGTKSGTVPGAEWAHRAGWQQIADCVSGVAWAQGQFMGLDEPVVPPFPMSDYGTGGLGCVAAMTGLYNRATLGGSWICRTSLVQYDVFLQKLGPLPDFEQQRLRKLHDRAFFALRHSDSVDEVGRRALASLKRVAGHLFGPDLMVSAHSIGFNGVVAWPREAIRIEGLKVGHVRPPRPNGFDAARWDDKEEWETDEKLAMAV
ncbi:CaiB baif family enzyme [Podospora conica]|nr:CaiB baif family enzyme [Schizothecium conicum]